MLYRFFVRACIATLGALFVLFVVASSTNAATCTWNGGSGDWHNASKWSCGAVPTANDDVVINPNSSSETITISQTAPAKNVVIYDFSGTIGGPGALNVGEIVSATGGRFPILNLVTNGSNVPVLRLAGIARFTDKALTPQSLRVLTATRSFLSSLHDLKIAVGAREISELFVTARLGTEDSLTVTQVFSLAGSISEFGAPSKVPTLTIGINAVMTVDEDPFNTVQYVATMGVYMPWVNHGTVKVIGAGGLHTYVSSWNFVNTGVVEIRPGHTAYFADKLFGFGVASPSFLRGLSVNHGLITINTTRTVLLDSIFDNYGRIVVNDGVLSSSSSDYFFHYDGTIELNRAKLAVGYIFQQHGGHIQLNAGSLVGQSSGNSFSRIASLGGTLAGTGFITGGLNNVGGTVLLDGVLTVTHYYRQGPTATLQVTLTSPTDPVRLRVVKAIELNPKPGIMDIAGTLIVNKAGSLLPKSGQRFLIGTVEGTAQGVFQQSTGNMAPAFSGFAGSGQLLVSEPDGLLFLQAKSLTPLGARGKDNGYTVSLFNPTTQTIQVSGIEVSIPISFAYKPGSTTGVYTANPTEGVQNGRRLLGFMGPITVAARTRSEFQFGIVINNAAPSGNYTIDINTRQTSPTTLTQVAPISVQFGSVVGVSIGVGTVVTQNGVTHILMHVSTTNIPFTVKVACPPELEPCGTLRKVFAAQVVNGKYVQIIALTQKSSLASAPSNVITEWFGEFKRKATDIQERQFKVLTDFENHANCIELGIYDPGISDPSCKRKPGDPNPPAPNPNPPGDDIGYPRLYDPSGVIRDAATRQPIPNATVTLYRIPSALPDTPSQTRDCRTLDTRGGNVWTGTAPGGGAFEQPGFTPAQISPNLNPQVTGADGRYGWNVVTGCWYVTVSAPGYIAKTSALVGVPPEVTDLDIDLTAGETPQRKVYLPSVRK